MSTSRPPLPDSYEGLLARAQGRWREGDIEGAIDLFRRLVEKLARLSDRILDRRPELRDLRRQAIPAYVLLLRQQGRFAEAIEAQKILVETDPERADLWRRDLAALRVAKGEVEAGLGELQALAEANPDDLWNWLALGAECRIEGRLAQSRAALDRALQAGSKADPQDLAQVHYQRFHLFEATGELDDALAAWEEAVALDPEMVTTIRRVYTMLTEAGRYTEALRYVARDENPLQAGFQRGLVASLTGSVAEAEHAWSQVAEMDPADFEYGHDAWVEAVLRQGGPVPALEQLQELLPRFGSVRLVVLSGIAWAMHGDQDMAKRLFQQGIDLMRYGRPPKQRLDSADWRLLDSLVADQELKSELKPYFAVVETIWG